MANDGNVNNSFRHLDLGKFPPWQLTVTLAGGEKRQIKIPYSEGDHVVGLPLGLDVPEVIAKNYKDLLCMVNGMTYIISNLTRKLDRQQQDAARYLEDANRYRLELQEVKCKIGSGMAVLQEVMTSISPSKKRKLRKEEYVPCETTTVSISEPEHLPSTRSSDTPAIPVLLVQESATEDNMNDLPLASVKRPRVEDISAGTSVDIPQVQTEMVLESIAGIGLIREPVDAMMTSSSANCLTVVDSTTLTTLTKKVIKSSMLNCDGLVDTSLHYENQLEFASRDEAKKWVVEKGKEKNCIIVSGYHSEHNRFEMVCKRSGKFRSRKAKDTSRIYKSRATKKCECPFKIVFNKTKGENGVWKMKVANGCHNHEDPESPVVHPADAKLKPQEFALSQIENCDDGHVAVGVQAHYPGSPPPTPSQQPSHSSGPSSCTTQFCRNLVNLPETVNLTQMKSSPSGHQDSGMMCQTGAGSELQPVSSCMRSPTPASNQSVAVAQAPGHPILLAQVSLTKDKEKETPVDSVNGSRGKAVDLGNLSSCSTVKTKTIESPEVVQLIQEPVEATLKTSSAN